MRAIDASIDMLDLEGLGFTNTSSDLAPGQPVFDPAMLQARNAQAVVQLAG